MPIRKTLDAYAITPELIKKVEMMAAQGLTLDQIAYCLDWNPCTLYKKKRDYAKLNDAIKRGQSKGIATITNALFTAAQNGNITAMIYYLKCRDRDNWKEDREEKVISGEVVPVNFVTKPAVKEVLVTVGKPKSNE